MEFTASGQFSVKTTVTILRSKVHQGDSQPVTVRSKNTVSPEPDGSQTIVF